MGRITPDFKRGMVEARASIALLQQHWPAAFPIAPQAVRPLASTILPVIIEQLGWNKQYASGVIRIWKGRVCYCNAVLRYVDRHDIDGKPSGQHVDEHARASARDALVVIAAARKRRAEREALAKAEAEAQQAAVIAAAIEAAKVAAPPPKLSRRPLLTRASLIFPAQPSEATNRIVTAS